MKDVLSPSKSKECESPIKKNAARPLIGYKTNGLSGVDQMRDEVH
jgi:hypothetical protein